MVRIAHLSLALCACALFGAAAQAQSAPSRINLETGGKLLLTRGITEVGGAGGAASRPGR